jgi:hypothetical protein
VTVTCIARGPHGGVHEPIVDAAGDPADGSSPACGQGVVGVHTPSSSVQGLVTWGSMAAVTTASSALNTSATCSQRGRIPKVNP